MDAKPTKEEMIAERARLLAEGERIKKRVTDLSAEIDAHLNKPISQQQLIQQQQQQNKPSA